MKIYILIFLIFFQSVGLSNIESERNELKEYSDYIAKIRSQDYSEIDFKRISEDLSILSMSSRFSIPERYSVYQEFQETIIGIPDYAEKFRDQLTKLYDDRLNAQTGSLEYNQMTASLPIHTTIIFNAVKSLPTKEMVLALADLYEYPKFDPRPADDINNPAEPIPMLAGKILNELPIKNRPYPKVKQGNYNDRNLSVLVEKWRLWCRDVKAGKIEPIFESEVFADGSSIPPIAERHRIRAPKPPVTKKLLTDTAAVSQESSWLWVTVTAGAATLLAGYAAWRVKKK